MGQKRCAMFYTSATGIKHRIINQDNKIIDEHFYLFKNLKTSSKENEQNNVKFHNKSVVMMKYTSWNVAVLQRWYYQTETMTSL